MQADCLTFIVFLIYMKLRMFLSALLNQSHNQQSAKKKKNVFTLITVNYYRKVTVVNTVTQIF